MNARKSRLRIPRVSLENHESDEDFVEPQNSEIRGRGGEERRERERERERERGKLGRSVMQTLNAVSHR